MGLVQLLHAQAFPSYHPHDLVQADLGRTHYGYARTGGGPVVTYYGCAHAQAAVSARVARHYLESSSLRERDLGAFHLQVALPSYHP